MAFFSIIIPVYNVEDYIEQCLESVLAQTLQDFEVIVVDDGSSDSSGLICERYREKYPDKMVVLHQENQGLLLTRRIGIKKATGDYFVFIDSDDAVRVDMLCELKKVIAEYECDMVIYNASTTADFKTTFFTYPFFDGELFEKEKKEVLYRLLCSGTILNSMWSKAVKRTIVDSERDYRPYQEISLGEDILQIMPLIMNAKKIVYLDQNLYYYRQREGSITRSLNLKAYKAMKLLKQVMYNYITLWNREELIELFYIEFLNDIYRLIAQTVLIKKEEYSLLDEYLKEISKDEEFEEVYRKARKNNLTNKVRFVLWLMYRKKVCLVKLAIISKKMFN